MVRERSDLLALCLVICVLGLTLRWQLVDWPAVFDPETVISSKANYGIAYFVNFFAFAYVVYCLCQRFPKFFVWPPLAYLGQHAIQVFSFHIFAIYMAAPLYWRAKELVPWGREAVGILIVVSLFLPAFLHQSFKARWSVTGGAREQRAG